MRKTLAALIGAAATVTMITAAGVAAASPVYPASTTTRPAPTLPLPGRSISRLCLPRYRAKGARWSSTARSTTAAST